MKSEFHYYIDRVISKIGCDRKREKLIREDLYNTLVEKQQYKGSKDPYELMGDPEEVAEEFMENLGIENKMGNYYSWAYGFEYISKARIGGIPLVHINYKRFGVAKGIIAIGGVAIGVVALGGLSIGILSIGGAALGLLAAVGGAAAAGGLSIGGFAAAYLFSLGGLAVSKVIAFGGFSFADISIGGIAKGIISVYSQRGNGECLFKAPANAEEVIKAVKNLYPHMGSGLLKILKFLVSNLTVN